MAGVIFILTLLLCQGHTTPRGKFLTIFKPVEKSKLDLISAKYFFARNINILLSGTRFLHLALGTCNALILSHSYYEIKMFLYNREVLMPENLDK